MYTKGHPLGTTNGVEIERRARRETDRLCSDDERGEGVAKQRDKT
jgi:hypothetical protein